MVVFVAIPFFGLVVHTEDLAVRVARPETMRAAQCWSFGRSLLVVTVSSGRNPFRVEITGAMKLGFRLNIQHSTSKMHL